MVGNGPSFVADQLHKQAALDAEGEPVFTAPPDGDPGLGDGLDWKKVFGVSALQTLSSISLAMTRKAVGAIVQRILDRLEARKELAIAKVAPKLVGVGEMYLVPLNMIPADQVAGGSTDNRGNGGVEPAPDKSKRRRSSVAAP